MTLHATLRLPPEILFGAGQCQIVGTVAARRGTRALVCTDERFAATDAFAAILASLERASVAVLVHDKVLPDVPRDTVATCVEEARDFSPDMVIGIGGGSCLDMAKCASLLIPAVAVCDPDLTMTCPPGLTAIAGADALTHAIEAFTAMRRIPDPTLAQKHVFIGKSALTDHFALLAIKLLGRSLETAYRDPSNAEARAEVMMGALAAGCAFGTAGTAAAHAIQYPVGALTHTAHGLGVATLMPYVMEYNLPAAAAEIAEVGAALGLDPAGRTTSAMAEATIAEVDRLFAAIGITRTLADLGLPADKLDWTAEQALGIERLIKNNPRPLDAVAMRALLQAAYSGHLTHSANR